MAVRVGGDKEGQACRQTGTHTHIPFVSGDEERDLIADLELEIWSV